MRTPRNVARLLIVAPLFVGAIVTVGWFYAHKDSLPGVTFSRILSAAVVLIVGTLINLFVRWMRWHYLVRRLGRNLPAKLSMVLYFGTLPAILTPFYTGELIRFYLLRHKYPGKFRQFAAIWILERASDALVLASCFAMVSSGQSFIMWILGVSVVIFGGLAAGEPARRRSHPVISPRSVATCLAGTSIAWMALLVSLGLSMGLLSMEVTFEESAAAFTSGSLLGGLSGVPGGFGVAGSAAILKFVGAGFETGEAVLLAALMRAGTTWFALCLGVATLICYRTKFRELKSGAVQAHFDDLAESYDGNIPGHIRERLLRRKTRMIVYAARRLSGKKSPKGLDYGCGQGWHAIELAKQGLRMSGTDLSANQVAMAEENAARAMCRSHFAS